MLYFFTNWIDFLISGFALLTFTCTPTLLGQPSVMPLSNIRITDGQFSFSPSESASLVTIAQGLVDEICHTDAKSLQQIVDYYNTKQGTSIVLNAEDAAHLRKVTNAMNCTAHPGGSSANTLRVFSNLGGDSHISTILSYDACGRLYHSDLEADQTNYFIIFCDATDGPTSSLKSIVDENGDRTMFVLPGVMNDFYHLDLDFGPMLQNESNVILFLDAYTWAYGNFKANNYSSIDDIIHAFSTSKTGRVAFSLGTSSLVEAKRDEIFNLIPHLDFLFGNEDEMKALFQTDDLDVIKAQLKQSVPIGVLTLGKNGAWVVTANKEIFVDAGSAKASDTTGAGDAFAGGFLFAMEHEKTIEEAAQIGACVANQIIQHTGGRPQTNLKAACLQSPHIKDEL